MILAISRCSFVSFAKKYGQTQSSIYIHIKPNEALYIQISGREARLGIKNG
jgi:hypothetical protein